MPPTVPPSHGILSREVMECFGSFDAHSAFDGFEPPTIAELSADSAQIDMGLFERKIRKMRAQHGKVERRPTEGDEQIVA